tara:strand:- start:524 stop:1195 length:672 start_codon:yes stop_codon:yes gene_type:complete
MSKLHIVPTPIGNLQDITYRAVEILSNVDLILAEDTRVSQKLLKHYNIKTKMVSYHMHNEHKITKDVIENLNKGVAIALISDAGTPGISDPGFLLIRSCIENNIQVECLPGATAFVPALVQSGIPTNRFLFEGFLPHKKGRTKKLTQLSKEEKTVILYESPHRLIKTLEDLCKYFGQETKASVSRELTKIHEETIHGTLKTIKDYYSKKTPKGEIVIVVASNK